MDMTMAQAIVRELHDLGCRDVFTVSGGAIAPLTEAFARKEGIRQHFLLHEQSAGIAAEAYGFSHLHAACLLVTSGPGATNAATPVAAAYLNSSPMVVISGQARSSDLDVVPDARQWGMQHLKTSHIVSTFVKEVFEIRGDSDVLDVARAAWSAAHSDRPGPVWIDFPIDLQARKKPVSESVHDPRAATELVEPFPADVTDVLQQVRTQLRHSRRPALLLGNGLRSSWEVDLIARLVSQLNIPTLLTWSGLDLLPSSHPLNFGRPGMLATHSANWIQQFCDCLLVLGARLDHGQTGFNPTGFAPEAKVFRVDIDPLELSRTPSSARWTNIEGDANTFVSGMLEWTPVLEDSSPWLEQARRWHNAFGSDSYLLRAASGRPRDQSDGHSAYGVARLVGEHASQFPTVVLGSAGSCAEALVQSLPVGPGQRVLNSGGLGSMGFGVAGAIGASLASRKGPTLLLESDGSLMMNPQDLHFIAAENLDVKIIILNSHGYRSIQQSQSRAGYLHAGAGPQSGLHLPSVVEVARAFGMSTASLDRDDDLEVGIRDFLESDLQLLAVTVSASEAVGPRATSRRSPSGVMETAPLELLMPLPDADAIRATWDETVVRLPESLLA